MVLSSVNIESFASRVQPLILSYVNEGKQSILPSKANTSLTPLLSSYNALCNVKDIEITDNSISFLTNTISLTSLINDKFNQSKETLNNYFVRAFSDLSDYGVDIRSARETLNYYMVTSPLSSELIFNIVPLKTEQGIDEEQGFSPTFRNYKSLQFSKAPDADNEDLYMEYKSCYVPVNVASDEAITITISGSNINVPISSLGLIESGAIGGNQPLNSDIIYLNRNSIRNTTNGQPLCLWLSGSSVLQGFPKQWMERWYDPNNITQGNAFIAPVNTSRFGPVIDIPSNANIKSGDVLTYNRLGPIRNKSYLDFISDTQSCYISSWGQTFEDTVNDVAGFVEGSYTYTSPELILDGSVHGHIPPCDQLLKDYNFTTSFWVYKDDWSFGPDAQIFGNFSNFEGYSINYCTGATTSLITFPANNGMIYGFNHKGYKIFEKDLNKSLGLENAYISHIVTDFFGARWLHDSFNNKLIKLESDDLLSNIIDLPVRANIKTMKLNKANQVVLLNTKNHTISAIDQTGNLANSYFISPQFNNFEILGNNTIKTSIADDMLSDNINNVFKSIGSNIYKNDVIFFHVGKKINCMRFDLANNLWILYDNNKLLTISPNQKIILQTTLPLIFNETSFEMNFVKEIINGKEQDILWIICNINRYILKVNSNGEIIKRVDLNKVVNLNKCNPFGLTTKGDFTDYEIRRKYERTDDNQNISTANPAFAVKMNLVCGNNTEFFEMFHPVDNLRGWVHFTLTHEIINNQTVIRLFINGMERITKVFQNIKKVNFGTKVSPFIIGGTSGKLGANNLERSISGEYFVGKFDDLRIHQKVLSPFEVLSLANNLYYNYWNDFIMYMPTNQYTCLEKVKFFHMNRPPGHKSNKFNLKITGFTDPTIQNSIKQYILANIDKLKPAHTVLNEIIFE